MHPETPAKLLSRDKLEEILVASKQVLDAAMKAGGSTIHSFTSEEGIAGDFQVQLQVSSRMSSTPA